MTTPPGVLNNGITKRKEKYLKFPLSPMGVLNPFWDFSNSGKERKKERKKLLRWSHDVSCVSLTELGLRMSSIYKILTFFLTNLTISSRLFHVSFP
jgi:hypothetical protein